MLEPLQKKGIEIKIKLNILLNKNQIKELFFKGIEKDSQQNLILYLFPDKFVTELENIRIEDYEKEFYEHNRRNIIIIFDLFGCIQNDFQAIIGRGNSNRLRDLISKPISENSRSKYKKIIDLKRSHGLGFSTNLIPEMFSMEFDELDDPGRAIIKQLRSFQAILSTIYLSGRVDSNQSGYSVQFRGIKQVDLSIKRSDYLDFEPYLLGIYELYTYAYDGFSIDKLELAEKFTSLIADNIESICKKAKDIEGATRSSYENILLNRTKDYFDARQSVQDTINSSIKDTSDNIVTLTKETAKEVYTIAGIILLGLVGTALDPKFNIWVTTFIVSLIISAYMLLAIGYYLETLKNLQDLGTQQYSSYIKSFKDILGEKTTKDFIDNENIKKSNDMFLKKLERARSIYELILIASLTTACFSVLVLLDIVQITLNIPKG
ncbi:MAG: hypothetical protein ABR985_15840 [Methanotrichaceae archaeon]